MGREFPHRRSERNGCLLGSLYDADQKRVEAIAEAARERAQFDTVIGELQHRIKNNLQIIIAFLVQKLRDLSPDAQAMLNTVIGRIQSVALAHDLLSTTTKKSGVNFDDYLRSLCANLPQRPGVKVEVEAQHISIPIDRAVPAGLVVNELVTNAIKYAFGNAGGHVNVHFSMIGNSSEARVSVRDDGRGMELPPKKGLGLTLVEKLAQQIQGRIEYEKVETGTFAVLCFPVAV